jgi:signal recognition particle GTPase
MGSLTPGQALVGVVNEELVKLMGEKMTPSIWQLFRPLS